MKLKLKDTKIWYHSCEGDIHLSTFHYIIKILMHYVHCTASLHTQRSPMGKGRWAEATICSFKGIEMPQELRQLI